MSVSDPLFEPFDPVLDPEGLITKFLHFEYLRNHRDKLDDVSTWIGDRMKVLFWYLEDYVRNRNYSYVVPLSAAQIAFLNGPAPIAGAAPAITIALYNFVLREAPHLSDLTNSPMLDAAVYWWCIEKAPRIRHDDSLVTYEQVALLRAERHWVGEDFAFNVFMCQFLDHHPEFKQLDMGRPGNRAAFFYYLILQSFVHPRFLKYLPPDAVRRALQKAPDATSYLDKAIARFCLKESQRDDAGAGRELRHVGEALLRSRGLSLERNATFSTNTGHISEGLLPRAPSAALIEDGVAVIGPVLKTSGLGQATRLSLSVLAACERSAPTVLNFDLDNPAPVGFATPSYVEAYRGRRGINLIHVNADTLPIVIAFLPQDIFADSYNIGYFFWELNVIPKCHHLALDLLDEIWVSSEYNRESYARVTRKPVVNVGMAVEPVPHGSPRSDIDAATGGTFVFLAIFDSFSFIQRKNPLDVIDAFSRAFPRGTEIVTLIIKTQNRFRVTDGQQMRIWQRIDAAASRDPRIRIVNETLSYPDLIALLRACDCYVSLHRSEGFGFGLIEAMQLGIPVVTTAYSGNMDFCEPDNCYLVDYNLISVREDEYIFVERGSQWAQPDLDYAASVMRAVAADPASTQRKGAAAAAYVQARFSIEPIARRYAARLASIRANPTSRAAEM